jgi:hypothetical protein
MYLNMYVFVMWFCMCEEYVSRSFSRQVESYSGPVLPHIQRISEAVSCPKFETRNSPSSSAGIMTQRALRSL